MRILTVGQSDLARDEGETAAGGGTRPSGQDIRATMQRKGEPRRGPVTPPSPAPGSQMHLFGERDSPVSVPAPPRPWCGAHLESNEKLGQGGAPDKAELREAV